MFLCGSREVQKPYNLLVCFAILSAASFPFGSFVSESGWNPCILWFSVVGSWDRAPGISLKLQCTKPNFNLPITLIRYPFFKGIRFNGLGGTINKKPLSSALPGSLFTVTHKKS